MQALIFSRKKVLTKSSVRFGEGLYMVVAMVSSKLGEGTRKQGDSIPPKLVIINEDIEFELSGTWKQPENKLSTRFMKEA